MSREHYKPGVPSVTELLKINGYYDQFPSNPIYLARGHWVHAVCDILAQGASPDMEGSLTVIERNHPDWDVSKWPNWAMAYRAWMENQRVFQWVPKPRYVYNESEGCQGTLDQLIVLECGLTLVEIKSVNTGACSRAVALQTAGYWLALQEKPKVRLGLALRLDSTYHVTYYRDYRDFTAFRLMCRWNNVAQDYR